MRDITRPPEGRMRKHVAPQDRLYKDGRVGGGEKKNDQETSENKMQ